MLRLYKELPEFGGFLAFDTISGSLSKIDEKKFKELAKTNTSRALFLWKLVNSYVFF